MERLRTPRRSRLGLAITVFLVLLGFHEELLRKVCDIAAVPSLPFFRTRLSGLRQSAPPSRVTLRSLEEGQSESETKETKDWRDFRAKLVQQELREKSGSEGQAAEADTSAAAPATQEEGWAYATPLIEPGSLLLSAPGEHFALNQQYFHKAIIFIVEHTETFTRGVILNRPTAFNNVDIADITTGFPAGFLGGADKWNVWCGGDCEGLNSGGGAVFFCIHTLDRLAEFSQPIIRGIYLIDLAEAQRLVAEKQVDQDDFLLLVGYCGWAPGQLQGELDRGDTWTPAAADKRVLLGRLREEQAALRARLEEATKQGGASGVNVALTAKEVGDGIEQWRQLYAALGPEFAKKVDQGDPGLEGLHSDTLLQRWINRCLLPPRHQGPDDAPVDSTLSPMKLPAGTVLRGSATAWVLGKPAERAAVDQIFSRGLPGQYLHKAVLVLVRDHETYQGDEGVLMVLVNGPPVGQIKKGEEIFFGGPENFGDRGGIMELKGYPFRFQGLVLFRNVVFDEILRLKALEVAEGVDLDSVLALPPEKRWEAAGGKIELLREAAAAQLGEIQRRLWYERFLGLKL